MRRRREEEKQQTGDGILDVNASMQGTLRFDDPVNLRINGKFEGTLDTKGVLMVGQGADVKANITGESISIAGRVNGNIKAAKALRLEESARLSGDVETPKLSIVEGAVLNGRLRMAHEAPAGSVTRGDWMTSGELAKYLEVETKKVNEWVDSGILPGTREGGKWIFERSKVDQWIAEGKVKE
ncbi:MAG: hypothetical protein DRP85_06675 [Candidatus Makaraimicrobium thalassicum]|nr:MAG: hypothetical protein DRP85_06675 [Candidatus Omnitrophota bacterium]